MNDPCEVCGGHDCPDGHVEVFDCPVCGSAFDEFAPQFPAVGDALVAQATVRRWSCQHMTLSGPFVGDPTCLYGCAMTA